jgi:hypothetical protein
MARLMVRGLLSEGATILLCVAHAWGVRAESGGELRPGASLRGGGLGGDRIEAQGLVFCGGEVSVACALVRRMPMSRLES